MITEAGRPSSSVLCVDLVTETFRQNRISCARGRQTKVAVLWLGFCAMSADKASFHRRRCVSLACISTQNAVRLVVCLFLVFVHFFIPNSYIIVTEVPARSMSFGGPMTEQELTMRWDRMFLAILGCAFVCLPWREMVVHHLQLRRTRSLVAPTAPTTSSRGEDIDRAGTRS